MAKIITMLPQMTNGDVIKLLYPNYNLEIGALYVYLWVSHSPIEFDLDWWNSPYEENEDEKVGMKMAKREFIEKNILLEVLRESDSYHAQTSREVSLLSRNRGIVQRQYTVSEREIIKPYLDKLKIKMNERDKDNDGEPLNNFDKGYHTAFKHLCKEIDNLLSEQGE